MRRVLPAYITSKTLKLYPADPTLPLRRKLDIPMI